jgi:hypothetical protein
MDQPPLLKSRKFWIAMWDVAVSIATYFISRYLDPVRGGDIIYLIGLCQVPIGMVIQAMTIQNVEGIKANAAIETSKNYSEANMPQPCPEKEPTALSTEARPKSFCSDDLTR